MNLLITQKCSSSLKKSFLKILVVIVCFAATWQNANAQATLPINQKDSLALVDFYNSTNGDNWLDNSGWLKLPLKKWYGITTHNGRVTNITLNKNSLNGMIPTSFGNLTDLRTIFLDSNNLSGAIPETIGNLVNLRSLILSQNKLTGSIPTSTGNLLAIKLLNLSRNKLNGTIPTTIGGLTSLEILFFNNNQLQGTLPSSLFTLSHLKILNLSYNSFNDTLSSAIENLKSLTTVSFRSNKFHGIIPSSIGNMPNLKSIVVDANQFSDSIPPLVSGDIRQSLIHATAFFHKPDTTNKSARFERKPIKFYSYIPIKIIGDTLLAVMGGDNFTKKTFYWNRDGKQVSVKRGDSTFKPTLDGVYNVSVLNSEDTSRIIVSSAAIKKGDSLTIQSNTMKRATRSSFTIPSSFANKRDKGGMVFHHPESFVQSSYMVTGYVRCDYEMREIGKENSGVEIRYKIEPIDTAHKTEEERSKIMAAANNPAVYKAYLADMASKISDKKTKYDIKELDAAKVKQDYNADWGATVMVDPCTGYGSEIKCCFIVAIHKNNVGDAYYLYILPTKESLEQVLKQSVGSLKFK